MSLFKTIRKQLEARDPAPPLYPEAVWRAENPNSWWQSVPRTWIRPLVSDQPPVITPGPSLSQGAH